MTRLSFIGSAKIAEYLENSGKYAVGNSTTPFLNLGASTGCVTLGALAIGEACCNPITSPSAKACLLLGGGIELLAGACHAYASCTCILPTPLSVGTTVTGTGLHALGLKLIQFAPKIDK